MCYIICGIGAPDFCPSFFFRKRFTGWLRNVCVLTITNENLFHFLKALNLVRSGTILSCTNPIKAEHIFLGIVKNFINLGWCEIKSICKFFNCQVASREIFNYLVSKQSIERCLVLVNRHIDRTVDVIGWVRTFNKLGTTTAPGVKIK